MYLAVGCTAVHATREPHAIEANPIEASPIEAGSFEASPVEASPIEANVIDPNVIEPPDQRIQTRCKDSAQGRSPNHVRDSASRSSRELLVEAAGE